METARKLNFSEVHEAIQVERQLRAFGGLPFVDTDDDLKLLLPTCYVRTFPQALREKAYALHAPLKWLIKARARGY